MKALFIIFDDLNLYSGISKKIVNQKKSLAKAGLDIKLCYLDSNQTGVIKYRKVDDVIIEDIKEGMLGKIQKKIYYKKILDYILKEKIELVYIRYTNFCDLFFNNFLKRMSQKRIKIVIEIPTYPYDSQQDNEKGIRSILVILERFHRNYMYKYVDRIITFSDNNTIFNIPTIQITNGVNLEEVIIVDKKKRDSDTIVLTGVAGIALWHGYDRMIESLNNYYSLNPTKKIIFNIVGDAFDKTETEKLKKIVRDYKLEEFVIFHGSKIGKELNEIYNCTDIAVGSLGIHRIGLNAISTIKNKEYAAKGLPIVYSGVDPSFREVSFVYRIEATDNPFELENMLDWFFNISETSDDIRKFAQQFSWDTQMKIVVDELKNASLI